MQRTPAVCRWLYGQRSHTPHLQHRWLIDSTELVSHALRRGWLINRSGHPTSHARDVSVRVLLLLSSCSCYSCTYFSCFWVTSSSRGGIILLLSFLTLTVKFRSVMELVRLNGRYRLKRKIAHGSFGKCEATYFVHNSPVGTQRWNIPCLWYLVKWWRGGCHQTRACQAQASNPRTWVWCLQETW